MTMGDMDILRRSRDLKHILEYDWLSDVLVALKPGRLNYSVLLKRIQADAPFDPWSGRKAVIQPRSLARTLLRMVENGLIVRHEVQRTFPRSVSYELTRAGDDLLSELSALAGWAVRHDEVIAEARTRYRQRRGLVDDGSEAR